MRQILKSKEAQGEVLIFFSNLSWALFPIFVAMSVSAISTLYAAGIATLFAALFFAILLTLRKQWYELFKKEAWKDILIMTSLIGIMFYILVFIGLSKTSPGNASIILLMEVFFTMLILGLWKKEKQSILSIGGGFLMVMGALFILFNGGFNVNEGDIYILIATALPPIGNYYSQRAREIVGTGTIMFIRSVISGIFMLLLAFAVEALPTFADIQNSWLNLFITGFFLLGFSKIFWIESIHRISITKSITLSAYTPAMTLLFAYLILGTAPTLWQILGFIPMVVGIYLISEIKNIKKISPLNTHKP